MPLAAMMMWKPESFAIALLSSTVSVNRRCGEFRTAAMSISGSRFDACLRKTSVARMAKRRIEKDRRRRNLAALHQIDEIDDQLLGALDREGWDEQGAVRGLRPRELRPPDVRGAHCGVIDGRSRSP